MLEKYIHIKTQLPCLPHLALLLSLILGIVIGFIVTNLTHKKEESCKIGYISRDEILALEKTRIARTKDKQLFFGKTSKAINLIQNIAKTHDGSGRHIIFIKGSYVRGKGVYSISEEVHKEVVQKLKDKAGISKREIEEKSEDDDADEEEKRDEDAIRGKSNQAVKLLKNFEKNERW